MPKNNPDNKMRSDGGRFGDKSAPRRAKGLRATGKIQGKHMTVGNGQEKLGMRRMWRWLTDDDE